MTQAAAAERFEQICGAFERAPPDDVAYEVVGRRALGGLELSRIVFTVDAPLEVPALIISAPGNAARDSSTPANGARPLAIALHQTTRPESLGKAEPAGLGGEPNLHYGLELAGRGFDVICPDYPLFGDYEPDLEDVYGAQRYASVTAKGIRNHIVAISVLGAFVGAPCDDVLAIGHSLGGSNALFLGMFDARVSRIICSAGFSDFRSYAERSPSGDLRGWARRDKYMPLIRSEFDLDYRRLPIDFDELIGSLAPKRVFLSMPQHDDVFAFEGAMRAARVAQSDYAAAGCPGQLAIAAPDCAHDFPDVVRQAAYTFAREGR
jgi:pimeloyl-ACP methyl ester carboxylesterase